MAECCQSCTYLIGQESEHDKARNFCDLTSSCCAAEFQREASTEANLQCTLLVEFVPAEYEGSCSGVEKFEELEPNEMEDMVSRSSELVAVED